MAGFKPDSGGGFFQGVASFDPGQDRVILWTRYTTTPIDEGKPGILLDVAKDKYFQEVIVSESVMVDLTSDFTVYVDVSNLQSNSRYYYRFRNQKSGAASVVGETKTLPSAGEATEVKMAVVSCANFQAGLFNVYGAVAESDVDVVIHLGDYIYENGVGGYGENDLTTTLGRTHEPEAETIQLEDYRTRYRQYRSDEQLQKAHQLKPFICVWDDHEIIGNAYKDGAQNHQEYEGSFEARKMNALQVWHEYLPVRVMDKKLIYRSFDFAGLVNLMMLDTRITGRDRQLDYSSYLTAGSLDRAAFIADWQNPNRTLLGTSQRSWLISQLESSSAGWQVFGNQVLMGRMLVPAELLALTTQIGAANSGPGLYAQYKALVAELVLIKLRIRQGDSTVSNEEKARVETVLPYNLDAWDGYPVEREMIFAAAAGKKLISLAGDTHNAWYSQLTDASAEKIGAEFATPSVSSPGLEALFNNDAEALAGIEQALPIVVDDLQYLNASQRGFLRVSFTASSAEAEWNFGQNLATKDITTSVGNSASEH
ncbi:alkaline phosphatase D family protein [Nafulsella turpanensis]|uniref:alkaline phosphatase D family protein n=1 Tax=Nafulsella turpanensis TaxID=1265690 RepID=UPI00191C1F1A|nr:alkaline phosphatase D family protein [Nafulsella turpanensis]